MNFLITQRNKLIPLLLLGCLSLILGYDYLLVSSSDASISISEWIDRMSHTYPSIAFFAGFVCGHLFFAITYKRKPIVIQ